MKGFEEFIQEKTYLLNVSPATVHWYRHAFAKLTSPNPTQDDLKDSVIRMRKDGLTAQSVNCFGRAINTYLRWRGFDYKMPKLKVEEKVPDTFGKGDIAKFAGWKPKTDTKLRLQVLVLLLADTGVRINEALSLRWQDVSLGDLLLTVKGKGRKERRIAFSHELRRHLFHLKQKAKYDLVFSADLGKKLGHRNVMRDVSNLCQQLGIRRRGRLLHSFRHSFAMHYIQSGGSVFHLQAQLGHSDLEMTKMYVHLSPEHLRESHSRLSMLT